jgi:hypothetical protein
LILVGDAGGAGERGQKKPCCQRRERRKPHVSEWTDDNFVQGLTRGHLLPSSKKEHDKRVTSDEAEEEGSVKRSGHAHLRRRHAIAHGPSMAVDARGQQSAGAATTVPRRSLPWRHVNGRGAINESSPSLPLSLLLPVSIASSSASGAYGLGIWRRIMGAGFPNPPKGNAQLWKEEPHIPPSNLSLFFEACF